MSHFLVGVFIKEDNIEKNITEALAPFQENNMNDCPKEYLEFIECTDDFMKEYEEHKEDYATLNEFMEYYYGCEKHEETGVYGRWENPNAKWDWYEIGGRWEGSLINKNGEVCDYAKVKDIDWKAMVKQDAKDAETIWNDTMNTCDGNNDSMIKRFSGILETDTKESFISRRSKFRTYAVLDIKGKWHSQGEMISFGISKETEGAAESWEDNYFENFINNADENLIFCLVDCHI